MSKPASLQMHNYLYMTCFNKFEAQNISPKL